MGGATVQWLRDGLGIIEHSADVEALAASVPDTGDVYLVPAFAGLGAPQWDAAARGTIVGLTRGSTRAHMARAALESIAFQTADLIEAMQQDCGQRADRIARRRRRRAQRPAAAVPGRPARRAGAAAREYRDYGVRRRRLRRPWASACGNRKPSSPRCGSSNGASSPAMRAPTPRHAAHAGSRPSSVRAAGREHRDARRAPADRRHRRRRWSPCGMPLGWQQRTVRHYLTDDPGQFRGAIFAAAAPRIRRQQRAELDELLAMQSASHCRSRSPRRAPTARRRSIEFLRRSGHRREAPPELPGCVDSRNVWKTMCASTCAR